MKTYTILFSLLCLCAVDALAQFDGTIYQSVATPVANQPTFAGWHGGISANISYTNQYPAIPITNQFYKVSTDAYVHKLRSGFSLNYGYHSLGSGSVINNRVSFGFSPKVSIGDKLVIMPAVDVRLSSERAEPTIFSSDIGPILTTSYYRTKFLNAGAGVGLIYINTFMSIYFRDFTQSHPFASSEINRKTYRVMSSQLFTIGHLLSAGNWRFTPMFHFVKTGDFNNLYLAMNSQYKWIYGGFRYHHNSDLSLAVGTEIKKAYRLSYSYNWSIARLGVQTGGAHEISVRALFLQKKAKKRFLENLPLF